MIIRNKYLIHSLHMVIVLALYALCVLVFFCGFLVLLGGFMLIVKLFGRPASGSIYVYYVIMIAYWGLFSLLAVLESETGVPNFVNRIVSRIIGYPKDPSRLTSSITFVYRARFAKYGTAVAVDLDPGEWPYLFYRLGRRRLTVKLAPGEHVIHFRLGMRPKIETTIHLEDSRHYLIEYTPPKKLLALTLKADTDGGSVEIREL